MLGALFLGVAAGAISFAPLLWGVSLARKSSAVSDLSQAGALLLGVLLSFVCLALCSFACIFLARAFALPFLLAEALALGAIAIVYGVSKGIRKN